MDIYGGKYSLTYIRELYKIKANTLGVQNGYGIYTTIVRYVKEICY